MTHIAKSYRHNLIYAVFENPTIKIDRRIEEEFEKQREFLNLETLGCTRRQFMTSVQVVADAEEYFTQYPFEVGYAISSLENHYEKSPFGDDAKFKAQVGQIGYLCLISGGKFDPTKVKAPVTQFGLQMMVSNPNHDIVATPEKTKERIESIHERTRKKYSQATELIYKSF